jgi:hypothetical protein
MASNGDYSVHAADLIMYALLRRANQPDVLGPKYRSGLQAPYSGRDERRRCATMAARSV